MDFNSPLALLYHTYNSLFLSLPFSGIETTGTHLALFTQACNAGIKEGKSPATIVESFWAEGLADVPEHERLGQLFRFIQYVERQVVLFDSVEDALFEQSHEPAAAGTLAHFMGRLENETQRSALIEAIEQFNLHLVLTAHPTQFYPGKVLAIIKDLGIEIKSNHLQEIRNLLMQLGKTGFVNRQKPTPFDEAVSLGWYLENIFYQALPDILFRLLQGLQLDVSRFENPHLLSLGFWPGGDRDGNPFVLSDTTILVAHRLRESILRCYYRDVRQLRRRLTFAGVEPIIISVENKLNNTLYYPQAAHYNACNELLGDLYEARNILIADHDGLFLEALDRFILKVRIFGFHFAGLDIRQESGKHRDVWKEIFGMWQQKFPWFHPDAFEKASELEQIDQLLSVKEKLDLADLKSEFARETVASFRALAQIQKENGERGCQRYIISNCQTARNVAEVLALARLSIDLDDAAPVPIDVVPLFETIDDLATADAVMESLYTNAHYAAHLRARGNVQTIMLGFSDGTKDGGYLRANWSIYQAKRALSRVSRKHGIALLFFDGRGGPPGRGGGNNVSFYAAQGPEIESKGIQITVQGQTVSSTYGTEAAACYNVERLLTAGLERYVFSNKAGEWDEAGLQLMDRLADTAYNAYLNLKQHPSFVHYLERITPLKWFGQTNIGSRPAKRGNQGSLRFEDLRAIPFVGAWAQMKQNVPGYYGFGAALEHMIAEGRENELKQLYAQSLFLRTLVENSMQSLSKSRFELSRYLADNPEFGPFWQMLYDEYERSKRLLLEISGEKDLLARNPGSRESIRIREDIVLPLSIIQQYALQQLQNEAHLSPELAEMYQKMVLRTMFGIINAARNAA